MKVLVACERSGIVRSAFRARGHDAWSADLEPAEDGSEFHIQGDATLLLDDEWDLLIAHPVCRRMTNAGVRWLHEPPPGKTIEEMWEELRQGAELFSTFLNCRIRRKAIENSIMHRHARKLIRNYRPATQIVQPWWFGDPTFKAAMWWLDGLWPLFSTDKLTPPLPGTQEHKEWSWVHRAPPGPDREMDRSRFHPGMAAAMADQWGNDIQPMVFG